MEKRDDRKSNQMWGYNVAVYEINTKINKLISSSESEGKVSDI